MAKRTYALSALINDSQTAVDVPVSYNSLYPWSLRFSIPVPRNGGGMTFTVKFLSRDALRWGLETAAYGTSGAFISTDARVVYLTFADPSDVDGESGIYLELQRDQVAALLDSVHSFLPSGSETASMDWGSWRHFEDAA